MKIKLAILENDKSYLNKIVNVFNTKYADKLETYSFTNLAVALSTLEETRIDVFIACNIFDIDVKALPKRCGFAYFVDSTDVEAIDGQRVICKFQKVELIYKQILSIYSESAGSVSGLKLGDESTKIILFSSPCGGVGTSTMAAACAMHFASQKKKTLYLNLETFGSSDVFLASEGSFNMTDIIYAIKSKKANLSLKLESCVKQDNNGVCFYSQSNLALEMMELGMEDIMRLISELKFLGSYDYIVMDMDFAMDKDMLNICRQAHAVVWVGDGSEISNFKIQRAYNALCIREQNADAPLTDRLVLIYNRFSSKTGIMIGDIGLRNIGGAPVYTHTGVKQILEQLAPKEMFDKII